MRNQLRALVALGFGALMLCGASYAADPGVTDTEIKLGNTGSYSGPASSAVPQVLAPIAYFKMLNEKGGINGRKVNIVSLDDGFSPPKTVDAVLRVDVDGCGVVGSAAKRDVVRLGNGTADFVLECLSNRELLKPETGHGGSPCGAGRVMQVVYSMHRYVVWEWPAALLPCCVEHGSKGESLEC